MGRIRKKQRAATPERNHPDVEVSSEQEKEEKKMMCISYSIGIWYSVIL